MSLFDLVGEDQKEEFDVKLPDVGEYPKELMLSFEKEGWAFISTGLRWALGSVQYLLHLTLLIPVCGHGVKFKPQLLWYLIKPLYFLTDQLGILQIYEG